MDRVDSRRVSSDLHSIVVDAVAQSSVNISRRSFNRNVPNERTFETGEIGNRRSAYLGVYSAARAAQSFREKIGVIGLSSCAALGWQDIRSHLCQGNMEQDC